ncbi:MAG: ComF family protein [Chloroflexia bacterium]
METQAPWLERLWQGLLDLLFPPRCVACRWPGSWLCPACLSGVGRVEGPVCERCGRPLLRSGLCPSCRAGGLALDCVRAPFFFEGALQRAVHELKYRGRRVFAEPLGELLAAYLASLGWPVSTIVPVPLHPRRERSRGYNQAALMARVVAGRLGWPVLERGLTRVRDTRPQVGLDREARLENVAWAFRWEGSDPPGRVVLLDDVYTTGATMEACARTLRQAGVGEVRGVALARPRFDPPGRIP